MSYLIVTIKIQHPHLKTFLCELADLNLYTVDNLCEAVIVNNP